MNILLGGANEWLAHPHTGSQYFGYVPLIEHKWGTIASGPIELRVGRYRHFGLNHIWFRHQPEILKHHRCTQDGLTNEDKVALVQKFVADIVRPGVPIHCEFESIAGQHRVQVLRSSAGIAALQPKPFNNGMTYSVITAYKKGYAEGGRVGTLEELPWEYK